MDNKIYNYVDKAMSVIIGISLVILMATYMVSLIIKFYHYLFN